MVLQRDMPLPVWGWAAPDEGVTVTLGDRSPVSTTADKEGKWRVDLPEIATGGPLTLTVSGTNKVVLEDILVGEVWLCSGQSNMQWTVSNSLNPKDEIAAADYPAIRHLAIPRRPASQPADDVTAEWKVCNPATAGGFTACGYFMGRELHKELGVPIGLINSSWGGTRIEPWVPPRGFAAVPACKDIHNRVVLTDPHSQPYKTRLNEYLAEVDAWLGEAKTALAQKEVIHPSPVYPKELVPLIGHQDPSTLYNGMVHALVPLAIRGAIWYQGESNHGEGMFYTEKMKALIGGWRDVWGQGEFPFYYVQIAPYVYGSEPSGVLPAFWEAQAAALSIPKTGMVIPSDIGNTKDIHPRNKQEVGRRLALLALANDYRRTELVCSGPAFKTMAIEGSKLRIRFDSVGTGLASRDGKPLTWFEIIGKETDFVKANAVIDGLDSVVLSAPDVKAPAAMRFAWHKTAEPNLMNKEGLPAGAFRAGEVPDRDWLKIRVDEAKQYTLVYTLDLAKLGVEVSYDTDNTKQVTGPFDRVAYFLELQKDSGATDYVYVSMAAFTDDVTKIGVPAYGAGINFQTKVTDMNVISNVQGIVTGTGLTGGNIEFWPHNYGPPNTGKVPNASAGIWDFGDQFSAPENGYGSMQVHNHEAKQTIFALNHWKTGPNADLGIGNSTGKTRDWTFVANAKTYPVKRLRAFVRLK